jgi:phosphomannomutase/phosphoglucomutase
MRTSSPLLQKAITDGLTSTGCHVFDIGETPSPVNYFLICDRKLDAGVQVTASHNPKEYNGLKLQICDAVAFAGEDIQNVRRRIGAKSFLTGKGSVEEVNAIGPYLKWLEQQFKGVGEGFTIAVDCGNGVTGPVVTEALRRSGASVSGLYMTPDGTFPHHPADPSKHATLGELQQLVTREKAVIGFGVDGDGDRLGVVDEKGNIRTADEVLLFLAQDYLQRFPGSPVVFTVSMSSTLETEIQKWGGVPVMCEVGHSFVEHVMRERGAPLGGEQSGHFFLKDKAHGYDDALIVALQILSILRQAGKPFSSLLAEFPKVFLAEERRPSCPDSEKTRVVKAITDHFAASFPVNRLDGARIDFGDGAWANIRQSNTAPRLSICIEARSPAKLKEVEGLILAHLKSYPEITWKE